MADIIDGKAIAASIREDVAAGVRDLVAESGIVPGLAVVLVDEDPASMVYVGRKLSQTRKVGIRSFEHRLPVEIDEEAQIGWRSRRDVRARTVPALSELEFEIELELVRGRMIRRRQGPSGQPR